MTMAPCAGRVHSAPFSSVWLSLAQGWDVTGEYLAKLAAMAWQRAHGMMQLRYQSGSSCSGPSGVHMFSIVFTFLVKHGTVVDDFQMQLR